MYPVNRNIIALSLYRILKYKICMHFSTSCLYRSICFQFLIFYNFFSDVVKLMKALTAGKKVRQ